MIRSVFYIEDKVKIPLLLARLHTRVERNVCTEFSARIRVSCGTERRVLSEFKFTHKIKVHISRRYL